MTLKVALLTLVWVALTGAPSWDQILLGAVVGWAALRWTGSVGRAGVSWVVRVPKAIGLALYFLAELVVANVNVAAAVLGPVRRLRPAIVAVPLDAESDGQILLLANLITLTPGTLSLDVSTDRRTLYVHVLHTDDPEAVRRTVKEGFERRVLEVLP